MKKQSKYAKRYLRAFKAEDVRLLASSDVTAAQLGRELGVTGMSLATWTHQAIANGDHPEQAKLTGVQLHYSVLKLENDRLKKELERLRQEQEILKKSLGIPAPRTVPQRYAVIAALTQDHPVRTLCRLLQVSASGYYDWAKRRPGPRAQANQILGEHLKRVFAQNHQTYGSPRLTRCLRHQQIPCSENRVARLMRQQQLRARSKRPYRPRTTDSRHAHPPAPNWLARLPAPARPNQTWVADITYIRTGHTWAYLAAVMDLCRRRIVGWALSCSLHTTVVQDALAHALQDRLPPAGSSTPIVAANMPAMPFRPFCANISSPPA